MKESAQTALSFVRARARDLGGGPDFLAVETDLHIHVPAGAVPKDGPSAGVADDHRPCFASVRNPGPRGCGDDGRDYPFEDRCCRSVASRRRPWRLAVLG